MLLPEQLPRQFIHPGDGHQFDLQVPGREALHVVLGKEEALESQAIGLLHAQVDATDRPHLATEADFASKAFRRLDGDVVQAGQQGCQHSQVDGRIVHPDTAGHVQEDVVGPEVEADPFFQHGQQHGQTPQVEAGGGPLGRTVDRGAHQGLGLDEHGTAALQGGGDGAATEDLLPLAEQDLAGVFYRMEAIGAHLVDAHFISTSEAVLQGAQDAVGVLAVALELEDGVHHVLQQFRPGDLSLLGDMSDEEHGDAGFLSQGHEVGGRLPDLGDGTGHGIQMGRGERLDGIEHHQFRLHLAGLFDHLAGIGLREDVAVGIAEGQPAGPHADLFGRFLPGHVEDLSLDAAGDLQEEGGLADTRVATQQGHRAGHDAPTQGAVELRIGEDMAFGTRGGDIPDLARGLLDLGLSAATDPRGFRLAHHFLHKGVPLFTGRTAPFPAGGGGATVGADEDGAGFGQEGEFFPKVGKSMEFSWRRKGFVDGFIRLFGRVELLRVVRFLVYRLFDKALIQGDRSVCYT